MASDENMSLGLCAASCPSRFFGVYNTDCYCGETIDGDDTQRVANSLCGTTCPGNDNEFCGGLAGNLALARRQSVPLSVLLTVYIRVADGDVTSGAGSATQTITETITSTGTVTACPDDVPDSPPPPPSPPLTAPAPLPSGTRRSSSATVTGALPRLPATRTSASSTASSARTTTATL